VSVALKDPEGKEHTYQARSAEPGARRWHATVPGDKSTSGWLPDGSYAVRVIAVDSDGEVHDWTPRIGSSGAAASVEISGAQPTRSGPS